MRKMKIITFVVFLIYSSDVRYTALYRSWLRFSIKPLHKCIHINLVAVWFWKLKDSPEGLPKCVRRKIQLDARCFLENSLKEKESPYFWLQKFFVILSEMLFVNPVVLPELKVFGGGGKSKHFQTVYHIWWQPTQEYWKQLLVKVVQ